MGKLIVILIIAGVIVLLYKSIKSASKEKSEFKSKVQEAYSGNCKAIRRLGNDFYFALVPKKFFGDPLLMPEEEKVARKYILYALAEVIDGSTTELDSEIERGDYGTIDSVNLAREFVEVCIEKYGDKGKDKVLEIVLARNLKIN